MCEKSSVSVCVDMCVSVCVDMCDCDQKSACLIEYGACDKAEEGMRKRKG